jgi:hypothetical protein
MEATMSLRCSTYAREDEAREALHALESAGVPSSDIALLMGRSMTHDVRREPVGGFAGPVAPEDPFGKYAGHARRRRQASGGWAGDPDAQRQGTFGDVDLGVQAIYERGPSRSVLSSEDEIRQLLRDCELPYGAIDEVIEELHRGRAVVVTETHDAA